MWAKITKSFEELQSKLDKALQEKNMFTDILVKIEEKTYIKRQYVVFGLAVLCGIYLMVGYGSQFLCSFIGFLYPAYASVKAIESHQKEDDTKWLTYWVVYSAFALLEFFTDIFLFWIPFYWFIKCLFLMYCMVPTSYNGSITIYNNIIKPFVLKHEKEVDQAIDRASGAAKDFINEAEDVARDAAGEVIKRSVASDSNKTD